MNMAPEEFERQKVCYEQNCQQMRSLNQMMWQVPLIAMTLTGGLWYGVSTSSTLDPALRKLLFFFCGFANICLIFVIQRVRSVMAAYLVKVKSFYPEGYAETEHSDYTGWLKERGVCNTFSFLMLITSLLSFIGFLLL